MNAIFWNCRGIGCFDSTIECLKDHIKKEKPQILFISETKASSRKSSRLLTSFVNYKSFVVPSQGLSGGLWLLWESSLDVEIVYSDVWIVHAKVNGSSSFCYFTGVYGSPRPDVRQVQWQFLPLLQPNADDAWICGGDFNDMMCPEDKRGGRPFDWRIANRFIDMVSNCQLVDLHFHGAAFTWSNKQQGRFKICERIDRVFCNVSWRLKFPQAKVHHVPNLFSDHKLLILRPEPPCVKLPRPFRFEIMWLTDSTCVEVIQSACQIQINGSPSFKLCRLLQQCKNQLKSWNQLHFGNVDVKIKKVQNQIDELQSKLNNLSMVPDEYHLLTQLEIALLKQYDILLNQKNLHWMQKARFDTLHNWEVNTKFFHTTVVRRRHRSTIDRIRMDNGGILTDRNAIGQHFKVYFEELFTSNSEAEAFDILNVVPKIIDDSDNERLIEEVTEEEIHSTVNSMGSLKAPGPDGYQAMFFKRFWLEIGPRLVQMIQYFFKFGTFASEINHAFIILIPKITNPSTADHYRPISLSNVAYKVIAKIMVKRMRPCLQKIVSPNQSAFLPGRIIHDNILLAQEAFHHIRAKTNRKHKFYALKLDMRKAYDRLEWGFIRQVLIKFGFHQQWIERIMFAITTVTYSILLNGSPYGHFKPTRGVRQGDPLSPYLFILCSEVLSINLHHLHAQHLIKGIKFSRSTESLTHLMYADDLLVFGKADLNEAHCLHKLIEEYCTASGQMINCNKSQLIHNKSLHRRFVSLLYQIHRVPTTTSFSSYLGVPSILGRATLDLFEPLIQRFKTRLEGWKAALLSKGGRLTLINSVLSALPTYTMSAIKFPVAVTEEMDKIRRCFLWGHDRNQRKLHYFAWNIACTPVCKGGLGIRKLDLHNLALLGKQAYALMSGTSLWARFMKQRYFPNVDFLVSRCPKSSSKVWKTFWPLKNFLQSGVKWHVGDGLNIQAWKDSWIPQSLSPLPIIDKPDGCNLDLVADFLDSGSGQWKRNLVLEHWPIEHARAILSIPLSHYYSTDFRFWEPHKDGLYTVKSAYEFLYNLHDHSGRTSDPTFKFIWKLNVPCKIRFFLWQCVQQTLPTASLLRSKSFVVTRGCSFCHQSDEDTLHLFLDCPFARAVWFAANLQVLNTSTPTSFLSWFDGIKTELSKFSKGTDCVILICCILWFIWIQRNEIIFQHLTRPPDPLVVFFKATGLCHDILSSPMQSFVVHKTHHCKRVLGIHWTFPVSGVIKVNIDGSSLGKPGPGGAGCVARDDTGTFILGIADPIILCSSFTAECYALRLGLLVAKAMKWTNVIFETDSKCLFQLLQKDDSNLPMEAFDLLCDIKRLQMELRQNKLQWEFREANFVADALAKHASSLSGDPDWVQNPGFHRNRIPLQLQDVNFGYASVWCQTPPSFISTLLFNDCSAVTTSRSVNF